MSFDKPGDPHARDAALARLLAETLRSRSASGVQGSACPDAEVLAAYSEHGLAQEETARWESHFVDCHRCQKIIAVLAASGEELAEAEVERLGSLAAASSVARQPVARNTAEPKVMIRRRPTLWRWLVPAVGMASAVALWFALHPMLPNQAPSSQRIAATGVPQNGVAQGATAASSAKPGETQVADANLPPPPAAVASGALRRDAAAPANSPAAATRELARKQEAFESAAPPPVSEADRAAPNPQATAKDKRVLSAQAAPGKSSEALDALTAAAPAAPAPPTPPPAANGERAEPQALDGAAGSFARNQVGALAKSATPPTVFGSPNRSVLWRLGSGGRIERSTDQGQTWQPQSSGVTPDLLAGAAPSEKIAWVAGRAGIILRTTDGEHWQRVAPPPLAQSVAPPGLAPDWIGVEARDALHATIISRDLHRFVTEDGGRTWVQQQ